jgi:hypothetical protein
MNCEGSIVGKYKTAKGLNVAVGKLHRKLWDFYLSKKRESTLVYSSKFLEESEGDSEEKLIILNVK